MELSPQAVRSAQFKTIRKGLDPAEVRAYLTSVADELERAQNQSTAMEARARAAVARMQEISEQQAAAPAAPTPTADEAETISRTLLLAQRTADQTLAEAREESARLVDEATQEANRTVEGSRDTAARLLEEARVEAREVGKEERIALAAEVNALMARRDFLESDVEHLEQFLVAQRARLREAAAAIVDVSERVPSGLGEVRRPLLSASDDSSPRATSPDEDTDPYGVPTHAADGDGEQVEDGAAGESPGDEGRDGETADGGTVDGETADGETAEVTAEVTAELAGLVAETDEESPATPLDPTPSGETANEPGFRLRFDDAP
jgi:DivIVA domain-containing protein